MEEPPVEIWYRGVVYKRYPDSEQRAHRVYYQASRGTGRGFLHRDVYRDHNGEIPEGYLVHHKDHDPFNNDPGNLRAVSRPEHALEHPEVAGQPDEFLAEIRPLASAWHGSPEGIEWHREHGRRTWDTRQPVDRRVCEMCGEEFDAWFDRARYCSRRCINRSSEGKYTVTATCPICGTAYQRDKYRERPITCSRKCGAALRKQRAA